MKDGLPFDPPKVKRMKPSHPGQDLAYREYLRSQTCVLTGQRGTESDAVEAMHVGTAGKGLKRDDECLPVLHSIHREAHQAGEMTTLRRYAPDWLLRAAFRAYARNLYRMYLEIGR